MRFFSIPLALLLAGLLALTASCDQEPITLTVPVSFDSVQFKIRPSEIGISSPRQFATAFRDVDSTKVYEALKKVNLKAFLRHIKDANLTKLEFNIPDTDTSGTDFSIFDTLKLVSKKPGIAVPQNVVKIPLTASKGTKSLAVDLSKTETNAEGVASLAYPHGLGLTGSTASGETLQSETTLSTSLDVDMIIELDPDE